MADRRRGSAQVYDIPAYKEETITRSEPSHSSARIKRNDMRRDEAPGAYARLLLIILLAGVVLYNVIDSKVQATAIRNEINTEQKNVDMLKSENTRMQAEIETKTSRRTVESYAENILGMQKLDKAQCEYISLESGNVIEIPDDEENFFVKITDEISEFLEYIRG